MASKAPSCPTFSFLPASSYMPSFTYFSVLWPHCLLSWPGFIATPTHWHTTGCVGTCYFLFLKFSYQLFLILQVSASITILGKLSLISWRGQILQQRLVASCTSCHRICHGYNFTFFLHMYNYRIKISFPKLENSWDWYCLRFLSAYNAFLQHNVLLAQSGLSIYMWWINEWMNS